MRRFLVDLKAAYWNSFPYVNELIEFPDILGYVSQENRHGFDRFFPPSIGFRWKDQVVKRNNRKWRNKRSSCYIDGRPKQCHTAWFIERHPSKSDLDLFSIFQLAYQSFYFEHVECEMFVVDLYINWYPLYWMLRKSRHVINDIDSTHSA